MAPERSVSKRLKASPRATHARCMHRAAWDPMGEVKTLGKWWKTRGKPCKTMENLGKPVGFIIFMNTLGANYQTTLGSSWFMHIYNIYIPWGYENSSQLMTGSDLQLITFPHQRNFKTWFCESLLFFVATRIYIYIYGRGRRFPERTSIRIIELEKKQCFTVVKWRFYMSFFSLLMSFNYGSIFFRPSKLKSIMDHHNMFFWCSYFLYWNYEVHILCYIKDHWKRV